TRLGTLALPPTGGTSTQTGGGVMASLTSYFGGNFINEIRGYASTSKRDAAAYVALPAGRVLVGSPLGDSAQSVANLSFGGNVGFPQHSNDRSLEITDEFSWLPGALQLTSGARLEGARFNGAPAENVVVDSLFGLRTDRIPTEVHVSPRVGFTWMFGGEDGPPTYIVRGGAGDFRSLTPTGLYSA